LSSNRGMMVWVNEYLMDNHIISICYAKVTTDSGK
jgi:hypothetical protein